MKKLTVLGYKRQINKSINWRQLKKDVKDGNCHIYENDEPAIYDEQPEKLASIFLGTVFQIMPSGKYYMPWACSNVTEAEAEEDEKFTEALEALAEKNGFWLQSGEGDPCDLFLITTAK